jgi:hypothetical protein
MLVTYTANYTKIESGYMGQLIEWPEVVTEGGGSGTLPCDAEGCLARNDSGLQPATQRNTFGQRLA